MRPASLVAWRWEVVEVGRHGDDRFADVLAEILLGGALHLLEHLRGDLRRRQLVAVGLHPGVAVLRLHDVVGHHGEVALHHAVAELASDQALDGEQRVGGIGDGLALGALADQCLAVREGDDGRRGAVALGVLDDPRFAAVHHGDARVRGAEVDADDLCHALSLSVVSCLEPLGPLRCVRTTVSTYIVGAKTRRFKPPFELLHAASPLSPPSGALSAG